MRSEISCASDQVQILRGLLLPYEGYI